MGNTAGERAHKQADSCQNAREKRRPSKSHFRWRQGNGERSDRGLSQNWFDQGAKGGTRCAPESLCETQVKDVNVKTKHVKPRAEGETGQIVKVEAAFHHSQVQPVTAAGDVSRVGKQVIDGKKVRVLLKTGEIMKM